MKRDALITEIERELARIRISDGAWSDAQPREADLRAALRDLTERVFGRDLQAYLAQRTPRRALRR